LSAYFTIISDDLIDVDVVQFVVFIGGSVEKP